MGRKHLVINEQDHWVYVPKHSEETWDRAERYAAAKDVPLSKVVEEALQEFIAKNEKWFQQKLDEFASEHGELVAQLERLHRELVHPNPNRYPDWKACLEANGLLNEVAREYSKQRGWKV